MLQTAAAPLAKGIENTSASPKRVLFVCTGNTCRSPMAAALLNDKMRMREICSAMGDATPCREVISDSAGLYPAVGAPISPLAAAALADAGVVALPGNDYTAHSAKAVNEALMAAADEVIGITGAHAMELLLRFPQHAAKISTLPIDISDPYGGDAARYAECLRLLSYAIHQRWGEGGVL